MLAVSAAGDARAQIYGGVGAGGSVVLSNFRSDASSAVIVAAPGPAAAPRPARARSEDKPTRQMRRIVDEIAQQLHVDARLLHAVIRVESNYNAGAVSSKGASGLMQLMPATAQRFGVKNLFDPRDNVEGGARYLKWLLGQFGNDLELALAAYNAGEQNVVRAGYRIPDFPETRSYVPKVLGIYEAGDTD
ncbi:lytic transglycosylase domain-containing protein [Noviherbaspirillum sp. DKR-6]|uniref:Lytic transglycosylase domain-containing protein n=2 Tax=Noviherbaspirillum pedocola TaxID=2801341 RepID=A0A934T1I6_9BURK|nr:lytic transglycosylase domain-containing protein [Noviherbaspirillum pedocola]